MATATGSEAYLLGVFLAAKVVHGDCAEGHPAVLLCGPAQTRQSHNQSSAPSVEDFRHVTAPEPPQDAVTQCPKDKNHGVHNLVNKLWLLKERRWTEAPAIQGVLHSVFQAERLGSRLEVGAQARILHSPGGRLAGPLDGHHKHLHKARSSECTLDLRLCILSKCRRATSLCDSEGSLLDRQ